MRCQNSIGNGVVVEKNENSLVVRGYLESPTKEKKVISVEFSVTSKTVFKKKGIIVDVEKHSDGKPFTPEIVECWSVFRGSCWHSDKRCKNKR